MKMFILSLVLLYSVQSFAERGDAVGIPSNKSYVALSKTMNDEIQPNLDRYNEFLSNKNPNVDKPEKLINGVRTKEYRYDIAKTSFESPYDSANKKTYLVYVTPIYIEDEIVGNLFGIVGGENNNRVLNIECIVSEKSESSINVEVTRLKGEKVGSYVIEDSNIRTLVSEGNSENGEDVCARSWWGCTRECISDVHIACHQDSHCSTMLWITNVSSGLATPKGFGGSASIGVACAAWCLHDSDADLLPEF
jgi:hypothetical protein